MNREFFKETQQDNIVEQRASAGNFNMMDLYDLDTATIKKITKFDLKDLIKEMKAPAAFYKLLLRVSYTPTKLGRTMIDLYADKRMSLARFSVSTLQ